MTNTKINYILVGIVAVIVGVLCGLYFAPKPSIQVGATPAGGTTSGQTYSSVTLPMSGTATSTSVLNNTGNDLIVTGYRVGCQGLGTAKSYVSGSGIAALTVTVATSSTANPITTNANANTVAGTGLTNAVTIATSTGNFAQATTTLVSSATGSTAPGIIWANGSYMTAFFNATTTGQCSVGVDTVSS